MMNANNNSLVDEIAHKHINESGEEPTSSSILGPFWSPNAPFRENGGTIIQSPHEGEPTLMHGIITDLDTKKPIPGAVLDIWQASSNGRYDFQDPDNQVPNNLRGKFRCNEKGEYWFYCLKPTAYSLPTDGEFQYPNQLCRVAADMFRCCWRAVQGPRPPPDAPRSHPSYDHRRGI